MKIIEKGTKTLPEEIVYVTRCKACGCKFTYMIKDIKYNILSKDLSGKLCCPQCKYLRVAPFKSLRRKYKGDVGE